MKHPLSIALILLSLSAAGQYHPELRSLYNAYKDEEAVLKARAYLSANANDAHALQFLGACMFDARKYDSALVYSDKAIALDEKHKNDFTFEAYLCKAKALYMLGKPDAAKLALEKSISSKASLKAKNYAFYFNWAMGLDGQYDKWYRLETEHMIFHIEDTLVEGGLKKYLDAYEQTYSTINDLMRSKPPGKIKCYIWKPEGKEKKRNDLPIMTRPELANLHDGKESLRGHNLTHVLAYWSSGTRPDTNRLVNEGIALALDQSGMDHILEAKKALENKYLRDVREIWKSAATYDQEIQYVLGAALMTYLLKNSTRDQIRQLVQNQGYENARHIYGSDFDRLMKDFNTMLGLHQ